MDDAAAICVVDAYCSFTTESCAEESEKNILNIYAFYFYLGSSKEAGLRLPKAVEKSRGSNSCSARFALANTGTKRLQIWIKFPKC